MKNRVVPRGAWAAANADVDAAVVVAKVGLAEGHAAVPGPGQDVVAVGVRRRDLDVGAVEPGVGAAVGAGAGVLVGLEAGVAEGHARVGAVAHALADRDQAEADKAADVVVAAPHHGHDLAAAVLVGDRGAVVLPAVRGDARARARVVGGVRRAAHTALGLAEGFEVAPRLDQKAVARAGEVLAAQGGQVQEHGDKVGAAKAHVGS